MLHLCGTVENVSFQNPDNGFTVLLLATEEGELVTVVGTLAGGAPGEQLALTGHYIEHKEYGRQFEAYSCEYQLPENSEDIEKYLGSGVIPGIGPATARRMVARFGDEALEILARRPEKLAEIKGFSAEKARLASDAFLEMFGVREAVASLGRLGLEPYEAIAVYRALGSASLDKVLNNPYQLCAYPIYISFARADAMAQRLSLEPDNRQRTQAAILYTLRHNMNNGHTCLPKRKLLQTVEGYFGIPVESIDQQLCAACELGDIQEASYDDLEYVYLAEPYRAELTAALRVRMMNMLPSVAPKGLEGMITRREAAAGMQYAPLQKQAIREALSHGVMVITGGPGTGKTTIVNAIIALFEEQAERVLLAAPTGRAAKRLSELTGYKASTIHRLLEVEFREGDDRASFKRNEKNPLRCDVLIVDEMSMVDAFLFESLLAALRPGCRLILVGDQDQLPSVGPGNVLKGILQSGVVPVVMLKEIFRQAAASLIVKNAHLIVSGLLPEQGSKEDDFFFLKSAGMACQQLVCSLVTQRLPASYGYSPVADIQVLCPMRKGPLGTESLNPLLQQLINPPHPSKPEIKVFDTVFRLGDKVMQVKNDYDIPFTRLDGEPGAGAFNGEIGIIERINKAAGAMTVLCDDRRLEYTMDNIHKLEIAYAITIHKSQGSEFDAVVIPLSEVPSRLQYRNLLYTGVTRAKSLCILAGEDYVLETMVNAGQKNRRYSCFASFLQDEDLV